MSADADGKNPLQTEVPFRFRIEERQDETTTGSIYMDRNIVTGLGVVSIESFVQCFYVIVQSGPCHTLNRYDTNGVFITHLQGFFRIKSSLVKGQRHFTHFNLPELGELFPYYLETG